MQGDFQVGDYVAQPQLNRINGPDRKVHVEPKVMDVLVFLARQQKEVVPKERLIQVVWAGTIVTDDVLKNAISELRKALGDDARNPSYIQTIPKRGYRLIAASKPLEETKTRRYWAVKLAVLLSGALTAVLVFWSPWTRSTTPPPARPIPLTTYVGEELHPALSPDGTEIAFVWTGEKQNNRDIYVMRIGSTEPHRLTFNPAQDANPTWSPDGTQIAFLRRLSANEYEVYVIPVLGGTEVKVSEGTVGGLSGNGELPLPIGLSWSPVGPLLAMAHRSSPEEPDSIFLLSLETGEKRRLTFPPRGMPDFLPRFSPDGGTVAFLRDGIDHISILIQSVEGGKAKSLASSMLPLRDLAWTSDGSAIVFSRSKYFVQDADLLRVPVGGGKPQRLSFGEGAYGVTVARNSTRLVWQRLLQESDIWSVGGPNSPEAKSPSRFAASSTLADNMPEYSPDGTKVAFVSNRSGDTEIWRCDADGRQLQQLTATGFAFLGGWSPSGDRIAFAAPETGDESYDILVVSATGGPPSNLTQDDFADWYPTWSVDGRWIYYTSVRPSGWQICKVPSEGGDTLQLTEKGGFVPRVTQDGRILFWRDGRIWSLPEDGEETLVLDKEVVSMLLWSPWRESIVYTSRNDKGELSFEEFNMTSGETTEFHSLEKGTRVGYGLTVSPDGRRILYTQTDRSADLMMVDNFN